MNSIVFYGITTLILLRMIGLGVVVTLFLDHKRNRLKISMLGWLIWVAAGIFPLVSETLENNFLSESLLVANGIAAALGALLIFLAVYFYFAHVSGKLIIAVCGLLVGAPIVLFLAIDFMLAANFSGIVLYLIGITAFALNSAKRKMLKELIGKAIVWFYMVVLLGLFWILFVIYFQFSSSEHSYGFYQSTDNLAAMANYLIAISITVALLILVVYIEHNIAQVEKYQLKDKYSHDLGNILQAATSAASLLALKEVHSQEELVKLELVVQKCADAATLVKEIRKL